MYWEHIEGKTPYITTGGAGGLVLNQDESYYHFVKVTVDAEEGVSHEVVELPVGQHPILKQLESFWFFIHSLFYVGTSILFAGELILAINIGSAVFVGKEYYPNYDIDPEPWLKSPCGWRCSPIIFAVYRRCSYLN